MNTMTPDKTLDYYLSAPKPEYESKGQEAIAQMLDEYGIAFYYKDPMLVWENGQRKIQRPDFTLPTYNNAVLVYAPAPDEAVRRDDAVYKENDIAALFINNSNLAAPRWKQQLYDTLEAIYHQPHRFSADRYQPL